MLLFTATAIHLISLLAIRSLPAGPTHLPHDHPERPPAQRLARYRVLMISSRWAMLGSYVLLFLLVPLVPAVLREIGLSSGPASAAASLMDVMRVVTFAVMGLWTGWYGRPTPLVLSVLALPAGAALVLFSGSLTGVLLGEVIFGVACGVCYFASLYYAMVVKNASVDAGGIHEGLIGTGFALGPAVGLLGYALAPHAGGHLPGLLLGAGPLTLLLAVAALAPLRRLRQG
jgi:MFS family permease